MKTRIIIKKKFRGFFISFWNKNERMSVEYNYKVAHFEEFLKIDSFENSYFVTYDMIDTCSLLCGLMN